MTTLRSAATWAVIALVGIGWTRAEAQEPANKPPDSKVRKEPLEELPQALSAAELLELLQDTDQKLKVAEQTVKDFELLAGYFEDAKARAAKASTYEPTTALELLRSAAKSGDFASVRSAAEQLYRDFFDDVSDQFFFLDVAAGSPAKRFFARYRQKMEDVLRHYQANARTAIPPVLQTGPDANKGAGPIRALTPEENEKATRFFSAENRSRMLKEYGDQLNAATGEVQQELTKARDEWTRLNLFKKHALEASNKAKKEINELAIQLGLPLFCATVLLLFCIPFIWQRVRGSRAEAPGEGGLPGNFSFSTLVEISTVLLLTMSILILGLAGKLETPVLGTLLGGISGYVLNRTSGKGGPGEKGPAAAQA